MFQFERDIIPILTEDNNDRILLLGGRINHDSLYSNKDYCKKLNLEIKKLNPTKIILVGTWFYAAKYYKFGILDDTLKIDYLITFCEYFFKDNVHNDDKRCSELYDNFPSYKTPKKELSDELFNYVFEKNKNIKVVMNWMSHKRSETDITIISNPGFSDTNALIKNKNVYFCGGMYRRVIKGSDRNCSDGLVCIFNLLKKVKLNLCGWSTFGGKEESNEEIKVYLQNLGTSEKQGDEADILKMMVGENKLNCLETNVKENKLNCLETNVKENKLNCLETNVKENINIINKFNNCNVSKHPFEHIVIDDFFTETFYENLSEEINNIDLSKFNVKHYSNGGKYRNSINIICRLDNISEYKNSKNYQALIKNNYLHILKIVDFYMENIKNLPNIIVNKIKTNRIKFLSYLHFSICKDFNKYFIDPHTDSENNVFSQLIYCPPNKNYENKNLGLELYSKKNDKFDVEKYIDFKKNRVITFAPNDISYHGVNCVKDIENTRNSLQIFWMKNKFIEKPIAFNNIEKSSSNDILKLLDIKKDDKI
jgi:hypothetical protein